MNLYKEGLKKGVPICLGYLPVSFAFGVMCVNGGISPIVATIISLTNLTSAGQVAGVTLMMQCASIFEIAFTVLIINLRYILMSLSLSQKIDPKTPWYKRILMSFSITDEIFGIASIEKKEIKLSFMMGLLTTPLLGWVLGTVLGSFFAGMFSEKLLASMDIALYAMFIACVIPVAKKQKNVLFCAVIAIVISCILEYIPIFSFIGLGFKVIIATIIACTVASFVFPMKEDDFLEVSNE